MRQHLSMWHSPSKRLVIVFLSSLLLVAAMGQQQQQQQPGANVVSLRSTVVKRTGNDTGTYPKCKITGAKSLVPPSIVRCKPSSGGSAGPLKGGTGGWVLNTDYCYYLDVGLVRAIAAVVVGTDNRSAAASIQDSGASLSRRRVTLTELGAGKGCYSVFMAWCGIDIVAALDGAAGISELTGGAVVTHDLSLPVEAKADWILSLEVAEHIPKEHEAAFVSNIVSNAKCGVILSWAGRGQAGSGHVNTQHASYVIELMASHGFNHDFAASCRLQRAAMLPWFKRLNGTNVYRRSASEGSEECPHIYSQSLVHDTGVGAVSCRKAVLSKEPPALHQQSSCYSRSSR